MIRVAQCPPQATVIAMQGITNFFGVSLGRRDLDNDTIALTKEEKAAVVQEIYSRDPELQCRGTGYATLTAHTKDGGVWILEGSKENHSKYEAIVTQDATLSHSDAIKMAGGSFYENCE